MYQISKLARFGVTIQFPKTFTIKETCTFDARSEFGNNNVNLSSNFGKKYLTGGIGFLADETFAIDVAYAHSWWKTYGDNYGTNLSRVDQDIAADKMLVTFSYRF